MYKSITCKTALNHLNSNYLPYEWDLNIYRGCLHHCQYCYALYSHNYLNSGDFFGSIYVKENIVEVLETQLKKQSWKHETINLGGVTDSYQAIETVKKFMPEILRLLIKYRTPISISTKSKLLLRDKELFEELAEVAGAHVAISVTTFDEELRKKIEPASSTTTERFKILEAFKGTKVMAGVLMMPILPYLTDSEENLRTLFKSAREAQADYVVPGLLNLRQPTKGHFLNFIKTTFPELYTAYVDYYSGKADKKAYRQTVYGRISKLKKEYPLTPKQRPFPRGPEQLTLF
ncbi:MAG: radical SAM protein [Candidatus Marinimicrobia bacterium]|nr:radical SAM protein [Candidatus Neomarinimicrobiota bacterium]